VVNIKRRGVVNLTGKSSNLKQYTYPTGYSIEYTYHNNKGTLDKVIQITGNKVIYEPLEYNSRGQMLTYKIADGGIFTSMEFDAYGMPTFIRTGKNNPGASEIQNQETNFNTFTGNLEYRSDNNYWVNGKALHEVFTYDDDFKNALKTWQVESLPQYSMTIQKESGNIETKSDFTSPGNTYQYSTVRPHAIDHVTDPVILPAFADQDVRYNLAGKVEQIENTTENNRLEISYGPSDERIKSILACNGVVRKTKYFMGGDFEVEVSPDGKERYMHYLPGGGLYISHNNPVSDSLNYILTDYQGTWYKVITDQGNTVEHYSFDPWGRRRNATNWTYTGVPTSFHYDRGYTGHEMLDAFGLINMNGRVYDPIVARFLSPDNYVQDPEFSHSYNRYSYCFNNPLKYTDPSGMQSIFRGSVNTSNPVRKENGLEKSQVYVDGMRQTDTFKTFYGGAGSPGLSIEYFGELQAFGIHPGDLCLQNGRTLSGTSTVAADLQRNFADGFSIYSYNLFGSTNYVLSLGDPKLYSYEGAYKTANPMAGAFTGFNISVIEDPSGQGGWDSNGDGKLQKNEADNYWLHGGGVGISVDNSKIDWTGLKIPASAKVGKIFSINTTQAFLKLPYETAATYGGTSFILRGAHTVEVVDQLYHYQYRPNNSAENVMRNFMNWYGKPDGQGTDFMIHYNNPLTIIK
jgi:RHS repeat-associated protein